MIMAEAVSMELAEKVGKSDAHHLIEGASKKAVAERRHLRDVLAGDRTVTAHLDADALARLFDPMVYQGASQALIDRLHVRAALVEGGFNPDDIKEIILQQALYCGVPAANHAVKEASTIVVELGLLKS
jgi:hypothetical protein